MSRRALVWLLATLLVVILAPLAAIGVLGGTTAGTRWLFDTAEPYFPEALSVGSVDGTLFRGVEFKDVWVDGVAAIDAVTADLVFWALPNRRVVFSDISVDGVVVTLQPGGEESAESTGVPEIDLPFAIELPSVQINDVRLSGENLERSIDTVSLAATFIDRRLDVTNLSVRSSWIGLDGSLQLLVEPDLNADATLRWRFALPSGEALTGSLALRGARDAYRIEHQLVSPASIATSGTLSLDPGLRIDLDSRWDEWQLPLAGDNGSSVVTRSATLRTAGSLTDLDVELAADVQVDEYPELRLVFEGNTDLASARIDALEISTDGADLSVDGRADWSAEPSADIRFRLQATPSSLYDQAPSGQLESSGTIAAQLQDAGPVVALVVEQLSGTLDGHPVTGGATVNVAPGVLDLTATRLALGDNQLTLDGSAGATMDLTADLSLGALSQLDARLAGRVDGQVVFTGPQQEPAIRLELAGDDVAFGENRAARTELSIDFTDTSDLDTRLLMTGVHVATLDFETLAFEQTGGAESHQFRVDGSHGTGSFAIAGDGAYTEPDWRGEIRSAEFRTEALADWSLTDPIEVVVSDGNATVSPFCLASGDGPGRVCGEFAGKANADLAGKFEVRRFPLAAIPVAIPGDARLAGFLEAAFDVERTAGSLNARGAVETVEASIETVLDGEPYTTTIDATRLDVDVSNNRLSADLDVQLDAGAGVLSADLEVDDVLSGDSPIDGGLVFDVPDLAAIAFLFPDVANPTGRMDARARIGGSRLAPEIESQTNVREAAFDVLPAGIRVTDLTLTLMQQDPDSVSMTGSARSGEGQLSIEGVSRLSESGNWTAEIKLTGADFELLRLPDWEVAASPDVRVDFADKLTRVRGSLTIPRAGITVKSVPDTAATPSPDVVVHGGRDNGTADRRAYDVDLTTTLGDDVSFSGFGLSTGITGELRITGTDESPFAGNGRLELRNGRYRAYGQNLVIERGDLTFNGPLDDPQLDVRAVRPIENADIVAGIRITGSPSNLRSDVFSEPAMSDAEALAYVLTGRPLSGGQSSSDADLLNKAAFALGLSQAGSVAAQIRAGLGLDTLELDGGASTGRIVAGKRIGDRLLVEYGYGIVDKLGTLLLRYQLTSRVILESRTGSMSALDVVYSVKRQ